MLASKILCTIWSLETHMQPFSCRNISNRGRAPCIEFPGLIILPSKSSPHKGLKGTKLQKLTRVCLKMEESTSWLVSLWIPFLSNHQRVPSKKKDTPRETVKIMTQSGLWPIDLWWEGLPIQSDDLEPTIRNLRRKAVLRFYETGCGSFLEYASFLK